MISIDKFVGTVRAPAAVVFHGLLAAALFSCAAPSDRPGTTDSPPVVLISIDTLRSDRLPAYGYSKIETPAIDALRADSVLFENAFTHINLTLPSHASIFTGSLPPEHGVRDNIGYTLPDEATTLAEVLREHQYTTAGFVSSFVLRGGTGIEQGFDVWDDAISMDSRQGLAGLQRDGADTLERASDWLRQFHRSVEERDEGDADPYFLFFHIYDPHAPYQPAEPFRSRYQNAYDAEVAESDAIIGGLLDQLREFDWYDEALIILLSDHGEGLMDHGEMDHLVFIYREVLQIPLMIKLPGSRFAGSTIRSPAQTSDVFWTILDIAGIDAAGAPPVAEEPSIQPRVLFEPDGDALRENPTLADRFVFSESQYPRIHLGWSDLGSMIQWPFHLIDAPRPELFDLAKDPAELDDVLRENRREYRALDAALAGIDRTLQSADEVDETTASRLASLGYVSGAGPIGDGPLPDPKDRVAVLEVLGRASNAFDAGRHQEAIDLYREVVESEPQMVLAYQQLGRTYRAAGRTAEALPVLERALELSGGAPSIALSLGEIHFQLGNLTAAHDHAQLAVGKHDQVHHLLARISLREGDLEAASEHMRRALENRRDRVAPLVTQVALLVKKERFEDALTIADEALSEFSGRDDHDAIAGLHLQRGNALARLGRGDEAEAAFRREIELSPRTLNAYSNLAFLLVLEARPQEGIAVLQKMVEDLDTPEAHLQAARTIAAFGDPRSAEGLLSAARRRWPRDQQLRSADLADIRPPSFDSD